MIFAFAGADTFNQNLVYCLVTVMGILLANIKTPNLDKILDFKESPDCNFNISAIYNSIN